MKKYIVPVLVLLFCGVAFAQVAVPPVAPAASGVSAVWAFLKPFLLAILATNAAMTLIHAILGKIPVVGPYLVSIVDVFMANPAHPLVPPAKP